MTAKTYLEYMHFSYLSFTIYRDEICSAFESYEIKRDNPMEVLIRFQVSLGNAGLSEGKSISF